MTSAVGKEKGPRSWWDWESHYKQDGQGNPYQESDISGQIEEAEGICRGASGRRACRSVERATAKTPGESVPDVWGAAASRDPARERMAREEATDAVQRTRPSL